jgi:REP element-mobilizing transposase RayT
VPTTLPPRIAGFSYRGAYRYHVVLSTHRREPHFREHDVCARFVEVVRARAIEEAFDLLVYCVMPDHVHLVVEGLTEGADLRRFVRATKQMTGFSFACERRGRLWQKGWFDRVLRREEQTLDVCRYVAANPVRARLAATLRDYPYLGSTRFTIDDLIGIDARLRRPTG